MPSPSLPAPAATAALKPTQIADLADLADLAEDLEHLDELSNGVVDQIRAGRLDEAERLCQQLAERYPDLIDPLERYGMLYEARGDYATAADYYRRAADYARTNEGFDPEISALWLADAERVEAMAPPRLAAGAGPDRRGLDGRLDGLAGSLRRSPAAEGCRRSGSGTMRVKGPFVTLLTYLFVSTTVGCASPEPGYVSDDSRQRLLLSAENRDKVLAEMRLMLESVHGALRGAADGNRSAIEEAARKSGMAMAADLDPEVMRQLPQEFRDLGMRTHSAFDDLADAIASGGDEGEAIRRLADLSGNCVGCHVAFRIEVAGGR